MNEYKCPRCGSSKLRDFEAPDDFFKAVPYPFSSKISEVWAGFRVRVKVEVCHDCGYIGVVARDESVIEEIEEKFSGE